MGLKSGLVLNNPNCFHTSCVSVAFVNQMLGLKPQIYSPNDQKDKMFNVVLQPGQVEYSWLSTNMKRGTKGERPQLLHGNAPALCVHSPWLENEQKNQG